MISEPADHDQAAPVAIGPGTGAVGGWFPALRTRDALDLLEHDPRAFTVLYLIAYRAQWPGSAVNWHGLEPGEALMGDYQALGMTRKQYREALARLERYGLATATKRTSKGTVVKLCRRVVFDPLLFADGHQNGQRGAIEGPSRGHQGATTNTGEVRRQQQEPSDDVSRRKGDPGKTRRAGDDARREPRTPSGKKERPAADNLHRFE